jgi:hypothetical protein
VLAVNTTVIAVVAPPEATPLAGIHGSNIRVVRPDADAPPLERAMDAVARAKRTTAPYLLHDADPLALVERAWVARYDGHGVAGELEVAVADVLARWRARSVELPDYYLLVDPEDLGPTERHWYLGVLAAASPARVVASRPNAPVTAHLGDLRPGPWWPDLDRVLAGIDQVVPDRVGQLAVGESSALITP